MSSTDHQVAAAMAALNIQDVSSVSDEKKTDDSFFATADGRSSSTVEREALDRLFEQVSKEKLQGLEVIEMPKELKNVKLYDHQKQGISWLFHNEMSNVLPVWWENAPNNAGTAKLQYRCTVTQESRMDPPRPVKGSILADSMGLGKTLQAIGLILANPGNGCTLIVSPVSVMANWELQLKEYAPHLKVEHFYGTNRSRVLPRVESGEVDVLLTSYHQLVSELKFMKEHNDKLAENELRKSEGKHRKYKLLPRTFCFDIAWFRVILDEAHEIRNPKTWFFHSVNALQTQHKLCLTGTPFVNRPNDIGTLLSFLEVDPLADEDCFERCITAPIKNFEEVGLARLRTIMAHVSLRRHKDIVESNLTEKTVQFIKVDLVEGAHKETLQVLFETTRTCIIELLRIGRIGRKLGAIFGLLLHVRQACCDLRLISARRRGVIFDVADSMASITDFQTPEGIALLEKLIGDLYEAREYDLLSDAESCPSSEDDYVSGASGDEAESVSVDESDVDEAGGPKCENCTEPLNEDTAIVIRRCQHVFCEECLDPSGGQLCPECGDAYEMSDLSRHISSVTPVKVKTPARKKRIRPVILEEEVFVDMNEDTERSPKIQALLDAIEKMEPDEKGVIFSQWTSFLNIIQDELQAEGHTYTRIDGQMTAAQRLAAMQKFKTEGCYSTKTPRFVLCSLRACGTGINLTRASRCFLMEPYWNVAVEDQAMDRLHRIGQQRPVLVTRFVMAGSIEEGMVKLQESKAALGKGSLHKITQQERMKAKLTFLRDLFVIKDADVIWDTDVGKDFIVEDTEEGDDVWYDSEDEPWI